MPTDSERRAAFSAVKEQILAIMPDMFESYVTDEHIWNIADSALWAAENEREPRADTEPTGGG